MDNSTSVKTILIADDDLFIVRAFKTGLERYDYTVVIAHDGEEAIQQITTVRPDLVLLDVIMPKKDGFEVLKSIKADLSLASIPVIMLTSLGQDSDEQTARSYGAADFLVKSNVSLNDILLRVQRLLEQAAEATASLQTAASTVPELAEPEAALIAESIKTEAETAETEQAEGIDQSTPENTVPDLTQPLPAEAAIKSDPEISDKKPSNLS